MSDEPTVARRPRTVPFDHSDEWYGKNTNSLLYATDIYAFETEGEPVTDEPGYLEILIEQTLGTLLTDRQVFIIKYCVMENPEAVLPAPTGGKRDDRFRMREAARMLGVSHSTVSRDLKAAMLVLANHFQSAPWVHAWLTDRSEVEPLIPMQRQSEHDTPLP